MPHLSPMSWLIMPIFLWTFMMSLFNLVYFTKPALFLKPHPRDNINKNSQWLWTLQDGRN